MCIRDSTYMLGFEESFGYLIKPFVRDKDAIQAVLIVAEIAAYYLSLIHILLLLVASSVSL